MKSLSNRLNRIMTDMISYKDDDDVASKGSSGAFPPDQSFQASSPHPSKETEQASISPPHSGSSYMQIHSALQQARPSSRKAPIFHTNVVSPSGHDGASYHEMLQDVDTVAAQIMAAADRHCGNKSLSVNELRTFLKGGEFEEFSDWLTGDRLRQFRNFDRDRDGALDRPELTDAVMAWMEENGNRAQTGESGVGEVRTPPSARSPSSRARSPSNRALSRSSFENSEAEKARLRYITKRMSGELHLGIQKNKSLVEKFESATTVIVQQRTEITECHEENMELRKDLDAANMQIHELKGMLDRVKLAKEHQMTARELVDKAVHLAGLGEGQALGNMHQLLAQQVDENARLREIVTSMTKMCQDRGYELTPAMMANTVDNHYVAPLA